MVESKVLKGRVTTAANGETHGYMLEGVGEVCPHGCKVASVTMPKPHHTAAGIISAIYRVVYSDGCAVHHFKDEEGFKNVEYFKGSEGEVEGA